MKILWLAAVLLIVSSAGAQEQSCNVQMRTANAVIQELQAQVKVMSIRAAQHYSSLQARSVELAVAEAEIARLRSVEE